MFLLFVYVLFVLTLMLLFYLCSLQSEESLPVSIVHSPNIRKAMTPSLRSPHKIHGSFLQKAMSAEKAGRSPSPGKVWIPSLNLICSRIGHNLRLLYCSNDSQLSSATTHVKSKRFPQCYNVIISWALTAPLKNWISFYFSHIDAHSQITKEWIED